MKACTAQFSRFGEIAEAKVITDRETGRSRGFGFVTFANDESAASAITEMNETELEGRTIKVNEAEDKGFRTGGGGGAWRSARPPWRRLQGWRFAAAVAAVTTAIDPLRLPPPLISYILSAV